MNHCLGDLLILFLFCLQPLISGVDVIAQAQSGNNSVPLVVVVYAPE